MARNYDRLIRFYDSWFDDINDTDKELSGDEKWSIIIAVRECQHSNSIEPFNNLPISIKRALSVSTMREQLLRIMERVENARKRGSKGGQATQVAALSTKYQEENTRRDAELADVKASIPEGYTPLSWYKELKKRRDSGDKEAARLLEAQG